MTHDWQCEVISGHSVARYCGCELRDKLFEAERAFAECREGLIRCRELSGKWEPGKHFAALQEIYQICDAALAPQVEPGAA